MDPITQQSGGQSHYDKGHVKAEAEIAAGQLGYRIQGKVVWHFFDEAGKELQRRYGIHLDVNGSRKRTARKSDKGAEDSNPMNRMPLTRTPPATEGAIWSRLLQPRRKTLSLEAARSILRLEFAPEDKDRMHELAAKARSGSLAAAEQEEIRNYERVGNLLALMKSKARQRLKKASSPNGSGR